MYREQAPDTELREWVQCTWTHRGAGSFLIVPDTCVDVLWDGRRLRLAGPDTQPVREVVEGTIHGVRFRTGCAPAVLGIPASALRDTRAELSELFDVGPWLERLQREQPTSVLCDFVRTHRGEPDPLMGALTARLRARPEQRLPRLAAELGVSERQLNRRCTAAVGYGPKLLARILRMQNFVAAPAGAQSLAARSPDAWASAIKLTWDTKRQRSTAARRASCVRVLAPDVRSLQAAPVRARNAACMANIIDSAEQFLWLSGRVLDRLRFEALFRGGSPQRVIEALLPYRNPDGGFGQGLEPDFRGPVSQPLCLESALRALAGIEHADALLKPALDWALSVRCADGGLPNVLGDVSKYPRAPWWNADPKAPGSLLPTASIAGLLFQRKSAHPFAREASAFCFGQLEAMPARLAQAKDRLPKLQALYETRASILFLDHTPERERAAKLATQLGEAVKPHLDPHNKELTAPLDFASRPHSLARWWFDDATIEQQLRWLRSEPQQDGGFPIGWEAFTPSAGLEWRAIQTLERLETLHAYGALHG